MFGKDNTKNIQCQVRLWDNVNVSRVCFSRIRLEHILCQVRLWSNFNASGVLSKDKAR